MYLIIFKKIVTLLLITALIFTMTTVVFSQNTGDKPGFISITGTYLLDGDINWNIHAGSNETGAQQKTEINGVGIVDKAISTEISSGKLTVMENTYLKSIKNLKMISAIKVGFSPADATHESDQIYAWYIAPDDGQFSRIKYGYIGTHDNTYIDSFVIDYESALSRGFHPRYINMSSPIAKASYIDNLTVTGAASIKETFKLLDTIKSLGSISVIDWYSLF